MFGNGNKLPLSLHPLSREKAIMTRDGIEKMSES